MKHTRTHESAEQYRKVFDRLWRRYLEDSRESASAKAFALWLIKAKPNWSRNSWNTYKWSSIAVMRDITNCPIADDTANSSAIQLLLNEHCVRTKHRSQNTSANVAKWVPECDRLILLQALSTSKSKFALFLIDFISATLATGLRPSEWYDPKISVPEDGYVLKLVVVNSKTSNNRSTGPTRTLRWRKLPPGVITSIKNVVAAARIVGDPKLFKTYLKSAQELLRHIGRRLFPDAVKHYALYSFRHQFAANIKHIYNTAECAALMGHISDATVFCNYSKMRDNCNTGGALFYDYFPEPDPKEVAKIRKCYSDRIARLKRAKTSKSSEIAQRNDPDFTEEILGDDLPTFPVPTQSQINSRINDVNQRAAAGARLWETFREDLRGDLDLLFENNHEDKDGAELDTEHLPNLQK